MQYYIHFSMFKTLRWISPKGKECETIMHESKIESLVNALETKGIPVMVS